MHFAVPAAMANEQVRNSAPHPATASELEGPLNSGFKARLKRWRYRLFPRTTEWLNRQSEPIKGSELGYDFRTYYFDRRNSSTSKAKALTAGGQLTFTSGWWNNLALAANYYTSVKLYAPSDSPGTGLLQPNNDNINVLGELNLSLRIPDDNGDMLVRLGRQTLNLPYVNENDARALPASHEGIILRRLDSQLDFAVGHLRKFKDVDSDEFVYMSEAAGAPGTDDGLTLVGARATSLDNFTVGAINYFGRNTFNTFYAEGEYHRELDNGLDFRVSAQYTRQDSVGDELVGDFDTNSVGLRAALGWNNVVFTVAGTKTSDDAGVRRPWGASASYISMQRFDFDRAGERAFLLGVAYDAGRWVEGLSGFAGAAFGSGSEDAETGTSLPDRDEYDITFDYRPKSLNGLWIRVRANFIDIENDGEFVRDYRIIINYPIRFL